MKPLRWKGGLKTSKCELLENCLFFQDRMSEYPSSAELMKEQFCLGDNSECARFLVYKGKGREHVPRDLFPRQTERAAEIITD